MPVNIPYFTPDVSAGASAQAVSAAVALPGPTDGLVYITNLGPNDIAFKLGTSNAVSVTPSTGMVLLSGRSVIVGTGGVSTYIALITLGGTLGATVNLTSGN